MTDSVQIYVSYNDKDKVKQHGCRWNPEKRSWFFPLTCSLKNLKELIELQKSIHLHFMKEIVCDSEVKDRKDCIKPDYKLCHHFVEYEEEEIIKIHEKYHEENKEKIKEHKRVSTKEYYEKNPDKLEKKKEYNRQYMIKERAPMKEEYNISKMKNRMIYF